MLEAAGAVAISFLGGFLGSVSGGGGLLTIPYLLFIGQPVDVAIATNRLGSFGMTAGSLGNFYKSKKINWKLVPTLSLLAVIGGFVGANLVIGIDDHLLETIAGLLLLLLLPTVFFNKTFGLSGSVPGSAKKSLGIILYFGAMIFGGFFGAGAGIFLIYILVNFFGMTLIKANATNLVAWTLMSLAAFSIFAFGGLVDYKLGFLLALGSFAGGYFGSKTAIKKGDGFVRTAMVLLILATSAKLLLF